VANRKNGQKCASSVVSKFSIFLVGTQRNQHNLGKCRMKIIAHIFFLPICNRLSKKIEVCFEANKMDKRFST